MHDLKNVATRSAFKFLFPSKALEEIHAVLRELLGLCTIVCHGQKLGGAI
jgi:hypothetical protein